jgi:hypothetical protein
MIRARVWLVVLRAKAKSPDLTQSRRTKLCEIAHEERISVAKRMLLTSEAALAGPRGIAAVILPGQEPRITRSTNTIYLASSQ